MYIRFCAALALTASLAFGQNIDSSRLRYTAPSGGVQRSGLSKWSDARSVKDFGALGDGTHDDTAAFQAAVDSIPSGKAGTIYCPDTAASYNLVSNVVTDARIPLFILASGCTFSGVGALPAGTVVKYDITGNLSLPGTLSTAGSIAAGGAITATGGVSANGPVSGTTANFSGALSAASVLSTTGPVTSSALQADPTVNTLKVNDNTGTQQFIFNSPYFLLGNPASTRLIGFYNAPSSNTLTVYDWNAAVTIGQFTSTSVHFLPAMILDAGLTTSAITSNGQINNTAGGVKYPDGTVQISAATPQFLAKSANYTILTTDGSLLNLTDDATSGAITTTLYTCNAGQKGAQVSIKKIDSSNNAISISPHVGDTIDGQSSQQLLRQYDALTMACDGANHWYIF